MESLGTVNEESPKVDEVKLEQESDSNQLQGNNDAIKDVEPRPQQRPRGDSKLEEF